MCQFSSLCVRPSLGCCVASMDVITLLGGLHNGVSASLMHPQMIDRGVNTCMDWLDLMVYHTLSKAEDESAPVFIHLRM